MRGENGRLAAGSRTARRRPARVRVDGRAARAQRTREAIVDALLDLLERGDYQPTTALIAQRAGVSPRSVFQHFRDVDELTDAAFERQLERAEALAQPIHPGAPLRVRIDALVAQRGRVLDLITPVRRASQLREPLSGRVAARTARARRRGRNEIARVFAAELSTLPAGPRRTLREALVLATGWSAWDSLRGHAGLSAAAARRVTARILYSLLDVRTRREGPRAQR